MQAMVKKTLKKLVVLGMGGTIAGEAASASDHVGYVAGQVAVQRLVQAVPALAAWPGLSCEQMAQVDSKNMSLALCQQLALRADALLADKTVQGIVVTHGTDTLEETAFFLHAVLPPALLASKPVVLTCAMRPATALAPDGPQNLLDAVTVASNPDAHGVLAVCAGTVHSALHVQKVHTYRLDAFDSGDAGALGYVEAGSLRWVINAPIAPVNAQYFAIKNIANVRLWPRVEIVMSHLGASGDLVDALLLQAQHGHANPVRGIVVAGTGNGTVHDDLEAALQRAVAMGIQVVRTTRCAYGRVIVALSNGDEPVNASLPDSKGLSPVKARLALMLALLRAKHNRRASALRKLA
jgi:L-asparaginase